MDNKERIKAIESGIQKRLVRIQRLDQERSNLTMEILREQGKLQLLKELEIPEKAKVKETRVSGIPDLF